MNRLHAISRWAALGAASLCVAMAMPVVSQAASIAAFNFNSSDPSGSPTAATTTATGITASISRTGIVGYSSASYSYDSSNFTSSDLANSDEIDLSVAGGNVADVTDLNFSYFRSGTGPTLVDVYTSVDGGAYTEVAQLSPGTSSGSSATTVDLLLNDIVNSSLSVKFVADASGLGATAGTFRLNNPNDSATSFVALNGTVTASAVPSPAAIPASLAGAAMLGVGAVARRRRLA